MHQALSLLLLLLSLSETSAKVSRLVPRAAQSSPISIDPAQNWDDDDGPWSSFTLQLGKPIQNVRVLISSSLANTWVVRSDGCQSSQKSCKEDRGRTFDPAASSSWKQFGNASLDVNQNLGPYVQGVVGNETLGLGYQGSGGPILDQQSVIAYSSQDLNFGMLGLNPLALSSDAKTRGQLNFLTALKNDSRISSSSFGYTAGNEYTGKKVYGSLTLGGYDASLADPLPINHPFTGSDPSRLLQVHLQTISVKEQGGKTTTLLSSPISASIDSTVSMIWLPIDVCRAFESAFGLKWDEKTNLYLVDEDMHAQIQQKNASVTFILANPKAGGTTNQIVLPYKAFDLSVKPPFEGISQEQKYFPLRRAANESQYTLGRTFLQEAYLAVDWDRRKFSVSQCNFTEAPKKLVSIFAPGQDPASGLSSSAKIGIGIGTVVGFLLVATSIGFCWLRRRHAQRRRREEASRTGINPKEGMIRQGFAKGEMGTGIENMRFEMEGSDGNALKPYGGQTPPWVDEKARFPGSNSPNVAEIDGLGQRAELIGTVGFYGGRGLHEMYDPSSVPPIELPTSASEAPTGTTWVDGQRSSKHSIRSSSTRPFSSSKTYSGHWSPFGFLRRSRAHTRETGNPTSDSEPDSTLPRDTRRAFGLYARNHHASARRTSGASAPSSPDAPVSSPDFEPTRPPRSLSRAHPSYRSAVSGPSAPSDHSLPSAPATGQLPSREFGSYTSNRSAGLGSSGPSAPSSPSSPDRYGRALSKHRQLRSPPATSSSPDIFSPLSRRGTFSTPSRRGTGDILSPISPEEISPEAGRNRNYFGKGR